MAVSRHRQPTRRQLILDALKLGVNTSDRLSDLLGFDRHAIQSELTDLALHGRIRRAGTIKEKRRGPPRQIWSVA